MNRIDRKGWKKVTFGDVCKNLNLAIADPESAGIERYVGLEHIVPENLRIRSWGQVANGTTFTKTFKSGQVLFGKRRAYQKKAALADFDGICSGDILVFEANEKLIDSRLLPFLVSNDRFFEYAVRTSAGSLSPRTKFQDLAKFQFLLPPKDQQARLAELLQAGDKVIESHDDLGKTLKNCLKKAIDIYLIRDLSNESAWPKLPLKKFLKEKLQYGANSPAVQYDSSLPRYIRITDIDDEWKLLPTDIVSARLDDNAPYLLDDGDFLFARTGNTVGKTYLHRKENGIAVFAGYLIRCILDTKKMLPDFLALFCRSSAYDEFIIKSVKIGAQPNINAEQYSNMLVPHLPIDVQRDIVRKCMSIENELNDSRSVKQKCSQIQKQLINQIFSA